METKGKISEFYFSQNDLKTGIPCVKSPTKNLQKTQFDLDLQAKWQLHMDNGHFRYNLRSPDTRKIKGKFGYLAQLNPNRTSNRRPPQAMLSLEQNFCKDKFNFTKIDLDTEGIFVLKGLNDTNLSSKARNVIIINVSPLEFGNSLLVPRLEDCLPQVLTLDSISLAIQAVLLSGVKTFKAAFNSLCAYASVNHQHWHLYYLENQSSPLETLPVKRLAGDCYEIQEEDYPAVGFAFQVESGSLSEITRVATSVFKLTHFLTKSNIGHNVFMTRGTNFKTPDNGSYNSLRIFVWAREKIVGTKLTPFRYLIAVCELSGQILCYDEKTYESLTEEEIAQSQKETCSKTFNQVRDQVKTLMK